MQMPPAIISLLKGTAEAIDRGKSAPGEKKGKRNSRNVGFAWARCSTLPVADKVEQKRVPRSADDKVLAAEGSCRAPQTG